MLLHRDAATRRPGSAARLALDLLLFSSVLLALPWLALARWLSGRR